jgi:hypothetical protein
MSPHLYLKLFTLQGQDYDHILQSLLCLFLVSILLINTYVYLFSVPARLQETS